MRDIDFQLNRRYLNYRKTAIVFLQDLDKWGTDEPHILCSPHIGDLIIWGMEMFYPIRKYEITVLDMENSYL